MLKERDDTIAHLKEKLAQEEEKVKSLEARINSISMQNDEFVQAINDLKKERDGLIASCETLEKRSLRMEDEARHLREELEIERRKNVKDEELKAREDKLKKMQVELESREKRVTELEAKLELLDTELHSKERWLDKEAEEYRNA
ncbi:MAG: hypothetical protein QXT63_03980, partial [Thermoplasmata archaeon]